MEMYCLERTIEEMIAGWSTDEMIELMGECEFALSHLDGRIKQLNVKGLRRLWDILTGIQKKNNLKALEEIRDILKITSRIQKVLMRRVDLVTKALISLNDKVNTQIFWEKNIVDSLQKRLSRTDVKVDLIEWLSCVEHRGYKELPDGKKILYVVSDLFDIVQDRYDLIQEAHLKTARDKLEMKSQIRLADFYDDIIRDKCLSLYSQEVFSYSAENISEIGHEICTMAGCLEDIHVKKIAEVNKKTVDDICREAYTAKLREDGHEIDSVELCQMLLKDLAMLHSDYIHQCTERNEQRETEQISSSDGEFLQNEKDGAQNEYSILRLTPRGFWLIRDGWVLEEQFLNVFRHRFSESNEKQIREYLNRKNPSMVTTLIGYLENIKGFLNTDIKYVSMADYYMYLWFTNEYNNVRKDCGIAFLEYYDGKLYVSGYKVDEEGVHYKRLFSGLTIDKGKTSRSIKKKIKEEFEKNGWFSDFQMFQTFKTDKNIDKKLEDIRVELVRDAWEDSLKADNNKMGEVIDALGKNS